MIAVETIGDNGNTEISSISIDNFKIILNDKEVELCNENPFSIEICSKKNRTYNFSITVKSNSEADKALERLIN